MGKSIQELIDEEERQMTPEQKARLKRIRQYIKYGKYAAYTVAGLGLAGAAYGIAHDMNPRRFPNPGRYLVREPEVRPENVHRVLNARNIMNRIMRDDEGFDEPGVLPSPEMIFPAEVIRRRSNPRERLEIVLQPSYFRRNETGGREVRRVAQRYRSVYDPSSGRRISRRI